MKQVLIAMLALAASPALASYNGPLVVKSSYPGFVPPEWVRTETCEVYRNKVVVKHGYGASNDLSAQVTETRPLTIDGNLFGIIAQAAAAELKETPNGLCDGPGTGVVAKQINPNDSVSDVVLFSTGGCGSPRKERQGSAARMLRDLVDQYCPKTHDFGADDQ